MEYLPYYTPEERERHCVLPGLTGLAQINGRNTISWEEKFKNDVQYVNHISFRVDIEIILNTIKKLFCGSNEIVLNGLENLNVYRK